MREFTARDMIPPGVYEELDSKGDSLTLAAMAADLRDIDPTMRNGDEEPDALEVVQSVTDNGDGRLVVWRKPVGRPPRQLDIPVAAAIAVPDNISGVENGTLLLWTNGKEHLLVPAVPQDPASLREYQRMSAPNEKPFRLTSPRSWVIHLIEQFEGGPHLMHAAIHPATYKEPGRIAEIKGQTLATFAAARTQNKGPL